MDLDLRNYMVMYDHLQMLTNDLHVMKQNADFQEGISQAQSTATPLPTPKFLSSNESGQKFWGWAEVWQYSKLVK